MAIQSFMTKNIDGLFMAIYISLIDIYDHSQREAQFHSWTFLASLMIFFDQKKREAQKQGTFLVHFWSFLTKNREAQIHSWTFLASLMIIFDQKSAKRKNKEHLYLIDAHFWLKKLTFVES